MRRIWNGMPSTIFTYLIVSNKNFTLDRPHIIFVSKNYEGIVNQEFFNIYISQILTQNPLKLCTIFLQTSLVD